MVSRRGNWVKVPLFFFPPNSTALALPFLLFCEGRGSEGFYFLSLKDPVRDRLMDWLIPSPFCETRPLPLAVVVETFSSWTFLPTRDFLFHVLWEVLSLFSGTLSLFTFPNGKPAATITSCFSDILPSPSTQRKVFLPPCRYFLFFIKILDGLDSSDVIYGSYRPSLFFLPNLFLLWKYEFGPHSAPRKSPPFSRCRSTPWSFFLFLRNPEASFRERLIFFYPVMWTLLFGTPFILWRVKLFFSVPMRICDAKEVIADNGFVLILPWRNLPLLQV